MKKLLVMNAHNYDDNMDEIYRIAVRGIIFMNGKLLLIESDQGEVKLPGGGAKENEDSIQTLCREVKEETGYSVIKGSIIPFGKIEEKRLSVHEPKVWHQMNQLFFCEVINDKGECDYSENERKNGFHQVFYSLEDAILKNEELIQSEGIQPWNQREYRTLLLIKDYLKTSSDLTNEGNYMQYIYTDGCNQDFIKLCHALDTFLNELVGGEENRAEYVKYNKLDNIHDVFVAYDREKPIGSASFKKYDDERAEVKRVFVNEKYRGCGIAKQLMKLLEEKAREKGFKYLILESGEPLVTAMALYRKIGFKVIPNYGQYKDMPESICMQKEI